MKNDYVDDAIKMLPEYGPRKLSEIFGVDINPLCGALKKHPKYISQYAAATDNVCRLAKDFSIRGISEKTGWSKSSVLRMLASRGISRKKRRPPTGKKEIVKPSGAANDLLMRKW